jgi:hypothetical protein
MKRITPALGLMLPVVLTLGACQVEPNGGLSELPGATPPAVTSDSSNERPTSPDLDELCRGWNPSALEWRELGSRSTQTLTDSAGLDVTVDSAALPPTEAERYNAGVEICPGIHLVITHDGDTRFVALEQFTWAEGPTLSHSGETGPLDVTGVAAGGPTWGIRDALIVGTHLLYSDAVIDTDKTCVRVDVHTQPLAEILSGTPGGTVITATEPCVRYQDNRRAMSAIRTHMGGALAWDETLNTLYLTVGDFHLGASTIGQAAGIGLEGTLLDYEILTNPSSMVGSVVAIADPVGNPVSRVFAKGLRNSLGIVVTPDSTVWLSDHGPSGGDELNLIQSGADYGWPLTSQGKPYDRAAWPRSSQSLLAPWLDFQNAEIEGTTPPVLSWTPAIAPGELVLYPNRPQSIAPYHDTMLLGSLRALTLFVLDVSTPVPTVTRELLVNERIRDLAVVSSGRIVMLSDSSRLLVVGR